MSSECSRIVLAALIAVTAVVATLACLLCLRRDARLHYASSGDQALQSLGAARGVAVVRTGAELHSALRNPDIRAVVCAARRLEVSGELTLASSTGVYGVGHTVLAGPFVLRSCSLEEECGPLEGGDFVNYRELQGLQLIGATEVLWFTGAACSLRDVTVDTDVWLTPPNGASSSGSFVQNLSAPAIGSPGTGVSQYLFVDSRAETALLPLARGVFTLLNSSLPCPLQNSCLSKSQHDTSASWGSRTPNWTSSLVLVSAPTQPQRPRLEPPFRVARTLSEAQTLLDAQTDPVVLCPGEHVGALVVRRRGAVLLGLGFPVVDGIGGAALRVEASECTVAGVVLQASHSTEAPLLHLVGATPEGETLGGARLFDVTIRAVPRPGSRVIVDTLARVEQDDVYASNVWVWRADHAVGNSSRSFFPPDLAFWTRELVVKRGVVVTGDRVELVGLTVEHTSDTLLDLQGLDATIRGLHVEMPYAGPRSTPVVFRRNSGRIEGANFIDIAGGEEEIAAVALPSLRPSVLELRGLFVRNFLYSAQTPRKGFSFALTDGDTPSVPLPKGAEGVAYVGYPRCALQSWESSLLFPPVSPKEKCA